jgi:hypothetical protein
MWLGVGISLTMTLAVVHRPVPAPECRPDEGRRAEEISSSRRRWAAASNITEAGRQPDRSSGFAPLGRGWLHVSSYGLTPPRRGGKAAFEWMAFSACLTWPGDAPGVDDGRPTGGSPGRAAARSGSAVRS